MSRPTRWLGLRASCLAALLAGLALGATTASAQFFDPTLHALDLDTGRLQRSPRLLGMGGVSLAVPDPNLTLSLWDFGQIPVGLATDDTSSTFDLRPGTDALSSTRARPQGETRQDLAARSTLIQMEGIYRNHETGGMFGLVGDLSGLRWDRPFASTVEVREGLTHPQGMPVVGGTLPRFFGGHMGWAAHMRFRAENVEDHFRQIVSNAAGEFIDLSGGQLPPPGQFGPTNIDVNTVAYGLSTAYPVTAHNRLALGIEREANRILATNALPRSSSETREQRPYWIGQAVLAGRIGALEYAANGIGRLSNSEEDWRFTTSAGVGGIPLTGRGNLLTRKEKSSEMHLLGRWHAGRAIFAGSVTTAANNTTIDPPHANDPTSFNRFLNEAFNRPGADSLAFPDSVVQGESRRRVFGGGAGFSYRLGRTLLGGEFNWLRDVQGTTVLGVGPRRKTWDLRAGLEHPLGKQLTARLGYARRHVDEDDFTAGNEYNANAFSTGIGYAPAGAGWWFESGYVLELREADFTDPTDPHQNRQNLAVQLHWTF